MNYNFKVVLLDLTDLFEENNVFTIILFNILFFILITNTLLRYSFRSFQTFILFLVLDIFFYGYKKKIKITISLANF